MPPRRKRPVSDKSDAPRVVCLFFDLHGDFRMTLKTNVPPREAAAPSIVERERECGRHRRAIPTTPAIKASCPITLVRTVRLLVGGSLLV